MARSDLRFRVPVDRMRGCSVEAPDLDEAAHPTARQAFSDIVSSFDLRCPGFCMSAR